VLSHELIMRSLKTKNNGCLVGNPNLPHSLYRKTFDSLLGIISLSCPLLHQYINYLPRWVMCNI